MGTATTTTWFHGTPAAFGAFDDAFRATGAGGAGTDVGFWFTSSRAAAEVYAAYRSANGGRVIEVALDLRNPLVVDVRAEVQRVIDELGGCVDLDEDASYEEMYEVVFPDAGTVGDLIDESVAQAKAAGHDGVIFKDIIDNPKPHADWQRNITANRPQDHALVFSARSIVTL